MSFHYGIDPRKFNDLPLMQPKRRPSFDHTIRDHRNTMGAPLPNPVQQNTPSSSQLYQTFDNLVERTASNPTHVAIEESVKQTFSADKSCVWFYNEKQKYLFCPSKATTCSLEKSIVSKAFVQKKIVSVTNPKSDGAYDATIDEESTPTLYIPLLSTNASCIGVLQLCRNRTYSDSEVSEAEQFGIKFGGYYHLLFSQTPIDAYDESNPISVLITKLEYQLKCRSVEVWQRVNDFEPSRLDPASGIFQQIPSGVVSQVFKLSTPLLYSDVTKAPGFNPTVDGGNREAVCMHPIESLGVVYAVVARGDRFGYQDQILLSAFGPLLTRLLSSISMSSARRSTTSILVEVDDNYADRLKALLEVAEILSGVLDIDALVQEIMHRACDLLNTERCSLFLVDLARQELVTRFQSGLDQSLRIPMSRGIVGHTATTGEIVNIPDAYSDPRFDQAVDKATGYQTRNLLTVPIYNNRGEIAGVTEMINKIDSDAFDENDLKMMMAFNVFCGISLDNAKLYTASIDLTRQLRGFVEMSTALNTSAKETHVVIDEILENAQTAINAKRATVFLNHETEGLQQYVNRGLQSERGTKYADVVQKERRIIAQSLLSEKTNDDNQVFAKVETTGEYIADLPLLTSTGQCLGVMEFESVYKIMPEDLKLLDCFAVFTAVTLERMELQAIAQLGHVEAELKKWLTFEERSTTTVPAKFHIPPEDLKTIYQINFDAVFWDGIGHFKVIFEIFNHFDLLNEFDITNEKFFKFLSEISSTYKHVPYHNWRHAVDVCQFITYSLTISEFDKTLTKFELFAMLVAAICHDANHDGFTNVFNVKAETPLGILFKNQSVMETHHCSITIGVISKEENNLFACFDPVQYKRMWVLIITLILVTDMAKHFEFLKQCNAIMDEGPMNMEIEDHRVRTMQLVLKCADVSNVSRPFELADKWCDVLCEEFFRQGDLEIASGMEYTSDLNDREHLDKPKSQIGFYTFVCLPLYQTAMRALPPLEANVNQVKSNLAVWKAETEARQKAAEASQ